VKCLRRSRLQSTRRASSCASSMSSLSV